MATLCTGDRLNPADLLRLPRGAAERAALELQALGHIARSGLVGIESPQKVTSLLRTLHRFGGLGALPGRAAIRDPNGTAIADELGTVSFAELDRRTNALANEWRKRGIGDGSGVSILCRNHRGFLDATFAAAKLGARALYLNTDFAGPQVTDVCAREGTDALVYDEEFAEVVAGAAAPRGRFIAWADGESDVPTLEQLIASGDSAAPPPPGERPSVVMLTSGTTGTPKGAPRDTPSSLVPLGALLSKTPFRAGEATYVAAPMFHSLGFANSLLAVGLGSTIVCRRRFDAVAAVEGIERESCSAIIVVPVMLSRILALGPERIEAHDLSSLRIVFCSGAQLEADLVTRAMDALGDVVYNLYGSTEVAYATIATPEDLRAAPGCAGRVPIGTTVRLYDEEGQPVEGSDRSGRIFVGNGFEFAGYTGGGSKQVIDGLMSSGDVGHFDSAGRLFIDGRDDEMIVSGGENVFPHEVEELLFHHPEIDDAAVIGVDDEKFGKRLRAFVVLAAGSDLDDDAVREHVKANLARYKVPRDVVVLDELPRNPSGKILKRELATR
ncbi:MAG: acyl-CoA synthetase [Solirubrobacterales bacterium]